MKYVLYYRTNKGEKTSVNCSNKKVLDLFLKHMLVENCCAVAYCKIYKSGEYGARKFVKGNAMLL